MNKAMSNLNLDEEPKRRDYHEKPSLKTACHVPHVNDESEGQRSLLFSDCIEVVCCDRAPGSLRLGCLVYLTLAIIEEPQEYLRALSKEYCLEIYEVDVEPRLVDGPRLTSVRDTAKERVFVDAIKAMKGKVFKVPYDERPLGFKLIKMLWMQIIICLNCTSSPVEARANEIRRLITRKLESNDIIAAAAMAEEALGEMCSFLSDCLDGRKVIVHMFIKMATLKICGNGVRSTILDGAELCKNKGITDFLLTVRYILDGIYKEVEDDIYKAERACLLSLKHYLDSLGETGHYIGLVGPEEVNKFSTGKYKLLFSFALGVARTLESSMASYEMDKSKIDKLLYQRGVEAAQRLTTREVTAYCNLGSSFCALPF